MIRIRIKKKVRMAHCSCIGYRSYEEMFFGWEICKEINNSDG